MDLGLLPEDVQHFLWPLQGSAISKNIHHCWYVSLNKRISSVESCCKIFRQYSSNLAEIIFRTALKKLDLDFQDNSCIAAKWYTVYVLLYVLSVYKFSYNGHINREFRNIRNEHTVSQIVHTKQFTSVYQRSKHAEKPSHVRTLQFFKHRDTCNFIATTCQHLHQGFPDFFGKWPRNDISSFLYQQTLSFCH